MPQRTGKSRPRMSLKSDDLGVLKASYETWRTTTVGEGGDSDTLDDEHPAAFGGRRGNTS